MIANELLINRADAYVRYGVRMGKDFINNLLADAELKPFVESESRAEDGKRVIVTNIRKASREITLTFTISANHNKDLSIMQADFATKYSNFMDLLNRGVVDIKVPLVSNATYRLIYTGKGVKYGLSKTRTFCTFTAKFEEPNPAGRG